MSGPRFAIVGAGAIGAYLGACLARGGADVTLIARGAHLAALRARGVTVRSERGDFTAHPAATDEIEACAEADVVVLGLKAYSLPELAPRIGAVLGPDACVLSTQNGVPWWFFQSFGGALAGTVVESVDPGGAITRSLPPARTLGAITYPATEIVEPGVIRHIEGTRFQLGEPDGTKSERIQAISAAMAAGGLKAPVDTAIRNQLWLKLIGNVAFNTATALTGATLGQLGTRPEMVDLLRTVMQECVEIGATLGIEIPVSVERRLAAGIEVGDHRTSMLQDLLAQKPLETGCLTGAVVEIADLVGVEAPATRALHACVVLLDDVRRAD